MVTCLLNTGGFVIPTDTQVTGTAINSGKGIRLTFPRFQKVITYSLNVTGLTTDTADLEEAEIDGSDLLQVSEENLVAFSSYAGQHGIKGWNIKSL